MTEWQTDRLDESDAEQAAIDYLSFGDCESVIPLAPDIEECAVTTDYGAGYGPEAVKLFEQFGAVPTLLFLPGQEPVLTLTILEDTPAARIQAAFESDDIAADQALWVALLDTLNCKLEDNWGHLLATDDPDVIT